MRLIGREVWYPLPCYIHMSRKCMRLVILTLLSKLENVSWPQAITYTIHVVVYGRRCKIERLLQQTANSKWYLAYRVARWAVPHSETTIYYFLSKIWSHHRVPPISSTRFPAGKSLYLCVVALLLCVLLFGDKISTAVDRILWKGPGLLCI